MSFEKACETILKLEGNYSNDPADAGGETRYGITKATARAYGYAGSMKTLPLETAKQIYKRNYWDKIKLDIVSNWHEKIALRIFDMSVNMGQSFAANTFQRSLNIMSRNGSLFTPLKVDGDIGPKTLSTLPLLAKQGETATLLKILKSFQGFKYISICESRPSQQKFIRGWMKRIDS